MVIFMIACCLIHYDSPQNRRNCLGYLGRTEAKATRARIFVFSLRARLALRVRLAFASVRKNWAKKITPVLQAIPWMVIQDSSR